MVDDLLEGFIFGDKTIGVNVAQFLNREKNKLLIFGYAGSGKTTLGERLADRLRVKWVSIDSMWWRIKEKYFKDLKIREALRHKQVKEMVYRQVIDDLRSRERMIMEGVDLLNIFIGLPNNYKGLILDQPMVILGTSAIKAGVRAAVRNMKRDNEGWQNLYLMPEYNLRKIKPHLDSLRRYVDRIPDAKIVEYKY